MAIPTETTADIIRRLRRVEGQVHGVQQMLIDGRGCREVLTQITAARKALDQAGFMLVADGLTWCVAHPNETDDDGNTLEDIQQMFLRLA
mgnify:CR=1 FL=1